MSEIPAADIAASLRQHGLFAAAKAVEQLAADASIYRGALTRIIETYATLSENGISPYQTARRAELIAKEALSCS